MSVKIVLAGMKNFAGDFLTDCRSAGVVGWESNRLEELEAERARLDKLLGEASDEVSRWRQVMTRTW